jgi:hypothetical protein
MKKLVLISLVIILPALYSLRLSGQCTPDTINCVDTLLPGEICPDTLPPGEVGVEYNQTVTVWPPSHFDFGEGVITIVKIHIISVDSLPEGLEYEANAQDMYPDTAYCVHISGTPADSGLFTLVITVQPYIDFFGNTVAAPVQVDDSSVSIRIYPSSSTSNIRNTGSEEFYIINEPNPFTVKTRIGCVTGSPAEVEFYVFDILGKLIYSEKMKARRGENYFNFTGENLARGIYIYSVINNGTSYSRRVLKK